MEYLCLEALPSGVVHLKLNRPEERNSLNEGLVNELATTLEKLASDPSLRILLLTGAGTNFCAGADLNTMKNATLNAHQLSQLMQTLSVFPKPTIALVQGAILGGGVGLVCCVDLVLAAPDTWFCFSEVKLGLVPAVISPYVLAAIGSRQARRYFLTAEKIPVQKALQMGLVHEVLEGDLMTAATPIIQMILKNGPEALTAAKQLIHRVNNQPFDEGMRQYAIDLIEERRTSLEGIEGMRAFLEKRAPRW